MLTPATRAHLRLLTLAGRAIDIKDPLKAADAATSLADARTALHIARGVPLDYIDPAGGGDFSPRSYLRARRCWLDALTADPSEKTWAEVRRGVDVWIARRPDVVAAVEATLGGAR